MDEKKLNPAALGVWLELNLQLKGIGANEIEDYLCIILILLNSTTIVFSDGDIQRRLEHYENFLKILNRYIEILKEEHEN